MCAMFVGFFSCLRGAPGVCTLSLHDALPISGAAPGADDDGSGAALVLELARVLSRERLPSTIVFAQEDARQLDRKSTRLNSSHRCTSYAVFCSKKNSYGPVSLRPGPFLRRPV